MPFTPKLTTAAKRNTTGTAKSSHFYNAGCRSSGGRLGTAARRARPVGLRCATGLGEGVNCSAMGFDQYHEPPGELSAQTRTFARLCASLTEEAEAIGWYEQRLAVEGDPEAAAIMRDAQGEEFKHFSMDLEFLLRRTPVWQRIARGVLFQEGSIVEHGEDAEAAANSGGVEASGPEPDGSGSLGIGSLSAGQP